MIFNQPLISIIIPCYNTEKYLLACLDSLIGQTLRDIEIICVNDASPDTSLQILSDYSQRDQRIKVITLLQNKGVGAARNIGIEASKGEYIGFVDSDDFVDLDFFEVLYKRAISSGADVVKGCVERKEIDGTTEILSNYDIRLSDRIVFFNWFYTAIYKKSLIRQYGLKFCEGLTHSEDRLFPLAASFHANFTETIHRTRYHYIRRENSADCCLLDREKINCVFASKAHIIHFLNEYVKFKNDYILLTNKLLMEGVRLLSRINKTDSDMVECGFWDMRKRLKEEFRPALMDNDPGKIIFQYLKNHDIGGIKRYGKTIERIDILGKLRNNINPPIPVFMSSDDNYAPLVATAMTSICYNTKSKINFYLLDGGISEENKQQIEALKHIFENFSIEFIPVAVNKIFEHFQTTDRITRSMYNRLLIPQIKPDINKAIYLDADIIVLGDISTLWNENLEKFPLGAVWDKYEDRNREKMRLDLSDNHKYFNSGILLIDCELWRNRHITKELFALECTIRSRLHYPDQDLLNKYFDENYKPLPQKYNLTTYAIVFGNALSDDVVIRHFEGPEKPWNSHYYKLYKFPHHENFLFYAHFTPFYDVLRDKLKTNENKINALVLNQIRSKIVKHEKSVDSHSLL
jgi:lipopolysaccharide biosynthesis glycosyltransferase/glycosyltransferase involved in cell wall biosynthesis